MATNTPSAQLHDLLVTHDFDVESKDAKRPNTTPAPQDADMFVFDFEANGNNYGTVVTLFDKDGTLNLFYGDNVGKSMEPADKKEWYDFLYQLTMFAKRNCPSFEMQNISRLKYTLKGISAINEGLFEGYYGNKKVSYAGEPTEARLMIKHNRQLGENDKRYRYVESLFIETADDQRFRLPFTNLAGGRAMLEHVRQGGKPYDIRGCHIAEIVEDAKVLSRFNRAKQNKIFEGETNELVEASTAYYESVRHTIKSLGNGRGYQKYFESWSPAQINETDTLVDSIKEMFIEQTLDSRIEQALPILAKIRQRETNMKEAQVFENWVNQVCEGTWSLPDDPDQRAKLQKLMSEPLLVGPDATNATEQLYDLVGDDQLFDILGDIADQDGGPDMNAWDDPRVMDRMYELGIDVAQPDGDQEQDGAPEDQLDEIGDTPAVEEGAMKHQMHADADRMSREQFCDKYGNENGEFWDNINGELNEGQEDSAVASALTRRIMSQRLDLLKKYGPVKVTQAIDSAAEFFGDVEEIGSSDLNAYMQYVEKELGGMGEQGVDEADMNRRGFLKGLGAAAMAGAAGASQAGHFVSQNASQTQDLGNGFVLTTIDVAGHTVKAVLDTESNISVTLNRGTNGSAIIRSQARFLSVKDGKIVGASMDVGPATTAAMKKAGLLENVEHGMEEAIDPTNPRDYEIPAYQRKEKGMPPLHPSDIEDKDNASPTTPQGLETLKNKLGIRENTDLTRIKQLLQKI